MEAPHSNQHRPHVVVLGAGFAGLEAAKALRGAPVRVTVIDRHNYYLFQPLLYQVATASLEPADIAGPIRQIIRGDNIETMMAEAVGVDVDARQVVLADRRIDYDYLVVATGSTHSYFGHDEWAKHAPGLKTLDDALEIRRRVLYAFEAAERCKDPDEQREWMTFVVVGAGPTGVELAGALAEIARGTHARDFDHIEPAKARILLLEGLPRVLTAYPEDLSKQAQHSLEHLGVEVKLNTKVTDVRDGVVQIGDETIRARTILWGAGVAASPIVKSLGTELDKHGRVKVTHELTVNDHPEIFVVGDLVALEQDGSPLPGLAPAAMSEGKHAAHNIKRAVDGQALAPFHYWDRGSFAVIGRGAAVGIAFKKLRLHGYLAWLAWLAIHITFLVGFRNRIAVLFNWAYVYFTRRRHAQLIIGEGPVDENASTSASRKPDRGEETQRVAKDQAAHAPAH